MTKELESFHRAIRSIHATMCETNIAYSSYVQWLRSSLHHCLANAPRTLVNVGTGDPASGKGFYAKSLETVLHGAYPNGPNLSLIRAGVIVHLYALWEENYRQAIAIECGLGDRDDVQSAVFQDLNKYRQAIVHNGGRMDRPPEQLLFFKQGETVAFTVDQMHELFFRLVEELNRIGKDYYGRSLGFSLANSVPSGPSKEEAGTAFWMHTIFLSERIPDGG